MELSLNQYKKDILQIKDPDIQKNLLEELSKLTEDITSIQAKPIETTNQATTAVKKFLVVTYKIDVFNRSLLLLLGNSEQEIERADIKAKKEQIGHIKNSIQEAVTQQHIPFFAIQLEVLKFTLGHSNQSIKNLQIDDPLLMEKIDTIVSAYMEDKAKEFQQKYNTKL